MCPRYSLLTCKLFSDALVIFACWSYQRRAKENDWQNNFTIFALISKTSKDQTWSRKFYFWLVLGLAAKSIPDHPASHPAIAACRKPPGQFPLWLGRWISRRNCRLGKWDKHGRWQCQRWCISSHCVLQACGQQPGPPNLHGVQCARDPGETWLYGPAVFHQAIWDQRTRRPCIICCSWRSKRTSNVSDTFPRCLQCPFKRIEDLEVREGGVPCQSHNVPRIMFQKTDGFVMASTK